jgi:hypothetical protein
VSPTFGYVVFRLREDRTLAKISGSDLPIEWGLKSSAVIKSKGTFGLFWPPDEYLFLDQDVNPDIRDFTYYSPLQLIIIRNRGNTYKYKYFGDNDSLPIDWRSFTLPLIRGRTSFEMNGYLFNAHRYNGVFNIMDNFTLKSADNQDLTIDLKKEVVRALNCYLTLIFGKPIALLIIFIGITEQTIFRLLYNYSFAFKNGQIFRNNIDFNHYNHKERRKRVVQCFYHHFNHYCSHSCSRAYRLLCVEEK